MEPESDRVPPEEATTSPAEVSAPARDVVNADLALTYWGDINADDSGMLGGVPDVHGFAHVSKVDLQGSRSFLAKLGIGRNQGRRTVKSALEGGAGIGRVTEGLLLDVAEEVDVVEPIAKFTAALRGKKGIRSIENISMSDWRPRQGVFYDLVWIQWCLGYLSDEHVVEHLGHCRSALRDDKSLIVVKENISTAGKDMFDALDGSVTREEEKFRRLFMEAGLRVVKMDVQKGIRPQAAGKLLPVKVFGLKASGSVAARS